MLKNIGAAHLTPEMKTLRRINLLFPFSARTENNYNSFN